MFFNALGEYPPQDQCDKELPACLANFRPMMKSGFLLPACQAQGASS
ncbi:hypothetical protein PS903_02198 [Pseudomonas fluorescens]|nr:hypothetical protein PS903_02198 [Pseudomonas fluorescens]